MHHPREFRQLFGVDHGRSAAHHFAGGVRHLLAGLRVHALAQEPYGFRCQTNLLDGLADGSRSGRLTCLNSRPGGPGDLEIWSVCCVRLRGTATKSAITRQRRPGSPSGPGLRLPRWTETEDTKFEHVRGCPNTLSDSPQRCPPGFTPVPTCGEEVDQALLEPGWTGTTGTKTETTPPGTRGPAGPPRTWSAARFSGYRGAGKTNGFGSAGHPGFVVGRAGPAPARGRLGRPSVGPEGRRGRATDAGVG